MHNHHPLRRPECHEWTRPLVDAPAVEAKAEETRIPILIFPGKERLTPMISRFSFLESLHLTLHAKLLIRARVIDATGTTLGRRGRYRLTG